MIEPTAPPSWPMLECAGPCTRPSPASSSTVSSKARMRCSCAEHPASSAGSAAFQSAAVVVSSTQGAPAPGGGASASESSFLGRAACAVSAHQNRQVLDPIASMMRLELWTIRDTPCRYIGSITDHRRSRADPHGTAGAARAPTTSASPSPTSTRRTLPRRRARLRVRLLARPVPRTTTTGCSEHLDVHPRSVMRELRFYRCGSAPTSRSSNGRPPTASAASRATATSAATTSRSTSTTSTPPSTYLREQGVRVLGEPTASRNASEGQRWVYFLSPWGMQFELVSYPDGKAYERRGRSGAAGTRARPAE